jgi:hypothetical protein
MGLNYQISGPGGIRTHGLFSAMNKNAGEKAKIAVFYVSYGQKSTVYFSILVPELYPQQEIMKDGLQALSKGGDRRNIPVCR